VLLEPIRMVADWLAQGTNAPGGTLNGPSSVNALLPSVPRDAGDPQPGSVTVYDATRDNWVARLMLGYEGSGITNPALAVFIATDVTADGEVLTTVRDGQVDIACMYVTQAQSSASAAAAGLYTARAVLRSLKQFSGQLNNGAQYDTVCRRNAIALRGCASLRLIHPDVVKGGVVVHCGVIATYHIRDEAP
jgi:hypothetical protein